MKEIAPQRAYVLHEIFNALRHVVRVGEVWRMMLVIRRLGTWFPTDPALVNLHEIVRLALERKADPSTVILDGKTIQSTPESGARAGFDGHKQRKGSKVNVTVDALGHLLALVVTAALARSRTRPLQNLKSIWKLPNIMKPNEGLRWYHGARSSNAPLPGRPTAGAWPPITNGWPQPWPHITGWPSPLSCSNPFSTKVNYRH